jgi:hypothetical protein
VLIPSNDNYQQNKASIFHVYQSGMGNQEFTSASGKENKEACAWMVGLKFTVAQFIRNV